MRLVAMFIVLFSQSAWAIVPVIDVKGLMGTLQNIQAIKQMKDVAHGDMEKLRGEFDAVNPLNFKPDSLSSHTWSADSWQSALSGGGEKMQGPFEAFKASNSDLYAFSNKLEKQSEIKETVDKNSVLQTESTEEYNQLQNHLAIINRLSNQIPTTSSTKAALDMNNKLLVEIAYLQVELLHMQVLNNQATLWKMHHDLKVAASTDQFLGDVGERP
jgi:hypothetical protein